MLIPLIGTATADGVAFVVNELLRSRLLMLQPLQSGTAADHLDPRLTNFGLTLSFSGWERFHDLTRRTTESRRAFMAMEFGDQDLDAFFLNVLKPAVAATGFELRRLDEGAPAGLIDDRLRVEIRASRFLIAELTHQNRGAYWEAGFAEGIDKPVIYICRKDVFDDKSKGPHFDTNHHLTVVWVPGSLDDAAKRLKDTIRATLPSEAKLED
jgi:hypothetical protein